MAFYGTYVYKYCMCKPFNYANFADTSDMTESKMKLMDRSIVVGALLSWHMAHGPAGMCCICSRRHGAARFCSRAAVGRGPFEVPRGTRRKYHLYRQWSNGYIARRLLENGLAGRPQQRPHQYFLRPPLQKAFTLEFLSLTLLVSESFEVQHLSRL